MGRRVKINTTEAKSDSGGFGAQELNMNFRVMFLAAALMISLVCPQNGFGAELCESGSLPAALKEAAVHLLADNFDDSDENFRFIGLANGSYIIFTEGGIYSLSSMAPMTLKELYRTGDTIEFLQLLYDNEGEMALVFAHQNMRAGIVSENYGMLQVDKKADFSATCYLLYIFQHDSENGGNGIDDGEKVDSIKLLDESRNEDPMIGFNVECSNYTNGSSWKELVVFRKNGDVFQLLTRRKLLR